MEWVLMAMLAAGPMDSYSSLHSERFATREACERALEWVKGGERRIRRIACLPAGDAP